MAWKAVVCQKARKKKGRNVYSLNITKQVFYLTGARPHSRCSTSSKAFIWDENYMNQKTFHEFLKAFTILLTAFLRAQPSHMNCKKL